MFLRVKRVFITDNAYIAIVTATVAPAAPAGVSVRFHGLNHHP